MPKKQTQKIIIPRGTINPDEDTLIEIPRDLQEQPVVVAKQYEYQSFNVASRNFNDPDSPLENQSRNKIVQDPEASFNPKFYSTANSQPINRTSIREQPAYGRKINNESSTESYPTYSDYASTVKPKKSNKSQNDNISKKKRNLSASILYQSQPSTSEEDYLPLFQSSRKKSDVSANVSFRSRSYSPEEVEEYPTQYPLKINKETSTICLNPVCSKSDSTQVTEETENSTVYCQSEKPTCSTKKPKEILRRYDKRPPISYQDSDILEERPMDDKEKIKKFYKCYDKAIDDIYIEQLKRQFEEAKRKLEDAVMLASISIKQLNDSSKKYMEMSRNASASSSKAESMCDYVPERDISFIPLCGTEGSCVINNPDAEQKSHSCRILNETYSSCQKPNSASPSISDNSQIRQKEKDPNNQLRIKPDNVPEPILKQPKARSIISYTLTKETYTQTNSEPAVKETKIYSTSAPVPEEKDKLKPGSSKCLECCSARKSSSIKFVKEPCCNITDSESLVTKTSTFLAKTM